MLKLTGQIYLLFFKLQNIFEKKLNKERKEKEAKRKKRNK